MDGTGTGVVRGTGGVTGEVMGLMDIILTCGWHRDWSCERTGGVTGEVMGVMNIILTCGWHRDWTCKGHWRIDR